VLLGGGLIAESIRVFPTEEQLVRMAEQRQIIEGRRHASWSSPGSAGHASRVAGCCQPNGLTVRRRGVHERRRHGHRDVQGREQLGAGDHLGTRSCGDLESPSPAGFAIAARLAERARVYERSRPSAVGPGAPDIRIDNDISRRSTVVEVHAPDGLGVLFRITKAIAELEFDIRSAKVQTLGVDVVDSFYVRDADGTKITEPSLLQELERAILHALND
jgi:[protein-PII] uridylyltransferase